MDAVAPRSGNGNAMPVVVDYKYALWRAGGEADYEFQMTAYALALMKAMQTTRAAGELWYLKPPLKIVRQEYTYAAAEEKLRDLLSRYVTAVRHDVWPAAERSYCDRVHCGFSAKCWSAT